jgi:muconolactone delta-isomerase
MAMRATGSALRPAQRAEHVQQRAEAVVAQLQSAGSMVRFGRRHEQAQVVGSGRWSLLSATAVQANAKIQE